MRGISKRVIFVSVALSGVLFCVRVSWCEWKLKPPVEPRDVELVALSKHEAMPRLSRGSGRNESTANWERFQMTISRGVWTTECESDGFFDALLDRDEKLAVAFFEKAPDGEVRNTALRALAKGWFGRNPWACEQWLNDGSFSEGQWVSILREISGSSAERFKNCDPRTYFDALEKFRSHCEVAEFESITLRMKQNVYSAFAFDNNTSALLAYLRDNGLIKETKDALAARAFLVPEEVVGYYSDNGKAMPDKVAERAVAGWLRRSYPDNALRFFSEHQWQDPMLIRNSAQTLMQQYLDQDSMAASSLLRELPLGTAKDELILAMAGWLQEKGSYSEIANWLPAISNHSMRKQVEVLVDSQPH